MLIMNYNLNCSTPYLRVINSTNGEYNDVELKIGLVNIGKGYLNDISIDNDPSISQIHSSIYFDGYTFSFFDLNSLNKTYLKRPNEDSLFELETNKPYQLINGTKIILSKTSELILYVLNNNQ